MLTLPYQHVEPDRIVLGPFCLDKRQRISASLSYRDPSISTNDVCIITPPLSVVQYDAATNRLTLDTTDRRPFGHKLNSLQETLTQLLPGTSMLQTFHVSNTLTLYACSTASLQHMDGTLSPITSIKAGQMIRCVIRMYGLLQADVSRYRLQHFVPNIWMVDKA